MSHIQKVILICRFFVGGGGGGFSCTHPCYLCGSQPLYFNLQAGPLQDSVHFPSLNYLRINVLIYVSGLVVHAHSLVIVLSFIWWKTFWCHDKEWYILLSFNGDIAVYFPFKEVWWSSLKILMGSANLLKKIYNYCTSCTELDTTHYKAKQGYSSWYLFVQTAVLNIIVLNFFYINPVNLQVTMYYRHLTMLQ